MTKRFTSTSIPSPTTRELSSILIDQVHFIDSKENPIEGFLTLAMCKYAQMPKLCNNSNSPAYAYFNDSKGTMCLPLSSEKEPKTLWDVNFDLNVS